MADESVDAGIVDALRLAGHAVQYVAELDPSMSDEGVLALSEKHKAPLLTADKDFGELVYRQRLVSNGVILVRLAGMSSIAKTNIVLGFVKEHASQIGRGFAVVQPGTTRIRRPFPA